MYSTKIQTCAKAADIFEVLNSLSQLEINLILLRVDLSENLVKNKKINIEADKALNTIRQYFESQSQLFSDFIYQSDVELRRIDVGAAGCEGATL